MKKKKNKIPGLKGVLISTTKYKKFCDNHPKRRAVFAAFDSKIGEDIGLCQSCWDEEKERGIQAARKAAKRQPGSKRRRAGRRSH